MKEHSIPIFLSTTIKYKSRSWQTNAEAAKDDIDVTIKWVMGSSRERAKAKATATATAKAQPKES